MPPARADAACDAWPWWFAPAGVFLAFAATGLFSALILGVVSATGAAATDAPGVTLGLTAVQDLTFIAAAAGVAASAGAFGPAVLGLRPVSRRTLTLWVGAGLVAFLAFALAWTQLTGLEAEQDTLKSLGTDASTANLVATAIVVVGLAPVAEEILFRGLAFRALRNALPVWAAAAAIGIGFGMIHYTGPDSVGVLVPLAVLGALFCLLYEWTGSLWPPIALHVVNNALALSLTSERAEAPIAVLAVAGPVLAIILVLAAGSREPARAEAPSPT